MSRSSSGAYLSDYYFSVKVFSGDGLRVTYLVTFTSAGGSLTLTSKAGSFFTSVVGYRPALTSVAVFLNLSLISVGST